MPKSHTNRETLIASFSIACVAGVQRGGRGEVECEREARSLGAQWAYKGEGGGKLNASAKRDRWALVGNACHNAIVFFIPPSQL